MGPWRFQIRRGLVVPFAILLVTGTFGAAGTGERDQRLGDVSRPVPASTAIPPLGFLENRGQVSHPDVRFHATVGGYSAGFGPGAVYLTVRSPDDRDTAVLLRIDFDGAARTVPEGRDRLPHETSFFLGAEPATWRTGVPSYGEILYRNLYEGVDLRYRIADGALKYEFLVDAGADPGSIALSYEGADGLSFLGDSLVVRTAVADVRDAGLVGYQDGRSVPCTFVPRDRGRVGFACSGWDPDRPLTIDPLLYATFLGGSGLEFGNAVAVDVAGNSYVGGESGSVDFPTTVGAYNRTYAGGFSDAFVAKFNPTGSALEWATFLGGVAEERVNAIKIDELGNVVVTGETQSPDFPTTPGALNRTWVGTEAFVAKIAPGGDALRWATFLGGSDEDAGLALALDPSGNVLLGGVTSSPDFPVTPGAWDDQIGGLLDGFVAKLDASGSSLVYATYLGGSGVADHVGAIALDGAGNAFVTGFTTSPDFPTTAGAFDRGLSGRGDAFAAKLNPQGTDLVYGTFLGGSGDGDLGTGIAVDASGTAYIAGGTESGDFPTTPGAYDRTYGGATDVFVVRLDAAGASLLYGTFLGGPGEDQAMGLALDASGRAYVAGFTASPGFPTTPGAFDGTYNGGAYDGFVAMLSPTGDELPYATFLGEAQMDQVFGLAIDSRNDVYLVGSTNSTGFPATIGAYDTTHNGAADAFLAKMALTFPVTVASVPTGLTLEVDGIGYVAPHTFSCAPGSSHLVNAPSPQASGGTRYAFSSWSDGGAQSHSIACSGPLTVTASFIPTAYEIVVATDPPALQVRVDGAPFPAPHSFWCVPGASHTIEAPSPQVVGPSQYLFRDWSDGGARFHGISCDGPATITASFTAEHQVVVATSPPFLQVVVDGVSWTAPRTFWWAEGSTHTLEAPSPQTQGTTRHLFARWSDGGARNHSVTVAGPATLTATFARQYEITIATSPPGLQVVVDGAAAPAPLSIWCDEGDTVNVDTPTPQGGPPTRYAFASWSDGGARAHPVPCDAGRALTAAFTAEHEVVLLSTPPGLQLEVEGVPAAAPHAFWCPAGESRTVGAPSPQGAGPTRFAFSTWSDGGGRVHAISCTAPASITVTFATEHAVLVATDPPGLLVTVDGSTAAGPRTFWFVEGSVHTVDVPSPQGGAPTRHAFGAWSDGGAKAHAITVDGPLTMTATFVAEHLVTLVTDPPGLAVIVDGVPRATPYSLWWTEGSSHQVDTPSPQDGSPGVRYRWSSWSDGGPRAHAITVTGPTTLTAAFETLYRLSATSAHGQPQCDVGDCWYAAGTVASLSIETLIEGAPGTRYAFVGWAGDASGTGPVVLVPMDGPKNAVAIWKTQHFLRVESAHGAVAGEGWYDERATATFSVTPTEVRVGSTTVRFAGWTGDVSLGTASGSVYMDGPKTVVATWHDVAGTDVGALLLALLLVFAILLFLFAWYRRRRDRAEDEPPDET